MFKLTLALAVVAFAAAAPVITLNLEEATKVEQTNHAGKYGVGCTKNAALCRKAAAPSYSESKFVHSCEAGSATATSCPLPKAVAYDHHDGDISDRVSYAVYLVNKDGTPIARDAECQNKNCIKYNLRSEWVTKFDATDKTGNAAETVIFATILNDVQAPVITPVGPYHAEACMDKVNKLPLATASDNIDGSVAVTVTPASVGSAVKTYTGKWVACDKAGMFGVKGNDNCAEKTFEYKVADTTAPKATVGKSVETKECKKATSVNARSVFTPACADACGNMQAVTQTAETHSTAKTGSTTFTWTCKDASGNKDTIDTQFKVVDTTKPVLEISDGGHSKLTRHALGAKGMMYKGKWIAFDRKIARIMSYDWNNNAVLEHRMGASEEVETVKELMSAGHGYRCSDSCGKTTVETSVHSIGNTDLACSATNSGNKVDYTHKKKALFVIKYKCSDEAGNSVQKCRTVKNVGIGGVKVNVFAGVPANLVTKEIKDAQVSYFSKFPALGVTSKTITAEKGTEFQKAVARRLLATETYRKDKFEYVLKAKELAKVYKHLIGCAFSQHLANELKLNCMKTSNKVEIECDPITVTVDVEIDSVNAATPLIVVPNPKQMVIEAMSSWSAQNPDKHHSTKAYCIKPCGNDDIMKCTERLPIGSSTSWTSTNAKSSCGAKKGPAVTGEDMKALYASEFKTAGSVSTRQLGDYLISYSCSYTLDGETYSAISKHREVKVVDTTKPVCIVADKKVTREASFPYFPAAAVCKDAFEGTLTTATTGSVNVEKTGKYVLTYTATDKSGNTANKVFKTVTVVDTLKPVIELSYGGKTFHKGDVNGHNQGVNGQENPVTKKSN